MSFDSRCDETNATNRRTAIHAEQKEATKRMDIDIIMESIGSLGKYHILLIVILYYAMIPAGMNHVGSVFLAAIPKHRCRVPELDDIESVNINFSREKESNFKCIIPRTEDGDYDTCWKCNAPLQNCSAECSPKTDEIVACEDGYVYDGDQFSTTIITEWNLVCDRLGYSTIIKMVYFIGVLIGSVAAGNACDRFGRTIVMVVCQSCVAVFGFGCTYAPNMMIFTTMRFFIGLFTMAVVISSFVYSIEVIGKQWRTFVGVNMQAIFALGYMTMSALSYRWRKWRELQLAISITSLPFLFMWVLLPESPRWLFSTGRNKKGKEISNSMASRNGKTITEETWKEASKTGEYVGEPTTKHYHPTELLKRPRMRMVTLIITLAWFTIALVYYGLTLNTGSLTGDERLNCLLGGVGEFISCPLVLLCFKCGFGRRSLLSTTFFVSGTFCIASTLVRNFLAADESRALISRAFALFGKTAISSSFAIIYVYTAELYPTIARGTAVGVGSMVARIGSILAPATIQIQYTVPWLTGVIFGVVALISGCACLLLPETSGAPLLTTMEEADRFYKRSKKKGEASKTYAETIQEKASEEETTIML